jgi:hypothetical protein
MGFGRDTRRTDELAPGGARSTPGVPGKQTLVDQVQRMPLSGAVQAKADTDSQGGEAVHAAAAHGTGGPSHEMPHLGTIRDLFGRHDVSGIKAHTDTAAAEGSRAMGAEAFAVGDHVAFGGAPSLHTAAHEAAHVVQQRGGVQLAGGVGAAGDAHEQHADAIADLVVQGKSAEPLLDRYAGSRSAATASAAGVQRKNLTQAGKQGDLTDSGATHTVFGNEAMTGRIFTITVGGTAADRTAALVAAAEQNAKVGTRIAGSNFHRTPSQLDKATTQELDPFFVRVTVSFTHQTQAQQLVLLYQHARQFNGYVVSIQDSSNPALHQEQPMDIPKKSTDPLTSGFKYANRHDQEDGSAVAGLTTGTGEKNVDAYTKIAGEGARWQCVRKFASKVKNTTRFFTAHDDTTVFAITFDKLWLNWKTGFNNKYDIPDSELATALRTGGTLVVVRGAAIARSTLTADDYNLDTQAGHVVS